ncbi:MAG TPA: hypothetical protein ENH45_06410 [Nitrospirae bacterium]|nr:hypothetical protein BMS3Abin09_01112 [bacterium BMS3Abin09]HDH34248.1 hypothetical protein [Nitrospirota bacterium]HDZ84837.1 hypothetical protein [Nitrospirota bacterium]
MNVEEVIGMNSGFPKCKALSIKERVEAANYAMEISGTNLEDEDISDIIGEVYSGGSFFYPYLISTSLLPYFFILPHNSISEG